HTSLVTSAIAASIVPLTHCNGQVTLRSKKRRLLDRRRVVVVARTKIESVDEVRRWYENGLTYKEMSRLHMEKYGIEVSPSGFASLRRRMGWDPRIAVGPSPLMPWDVRE